MQTVAEHLGPVEVLVNNAGVGSAADVAEMSEPIGTPFSAGGRSHAP
jgi:NAD(P)-dependent dehydrogenase (short-subunit alcohol dehydrogenase family)